MGSAKISQTTLESSHLGLSWRLLSSLGPPLALSWALVVAPGALLGVPRGVSGCHLEDFLSSLGALWVPRGAQGGQGPKSDHP